MILGSGQIRIEPGDATTPERRKVADLAILTAFRDMAARLGHPDGTQQPLLVIKIERGARSAFSHLSLGYLARLRNEGPDVNIQIEEER